MRKTLLCMMAFAACSFAQPRGRVYVTDPLNGTVQKSWTWIREAPDAHKIGKDGMHLRVLSGTLWAKDNSGSNMLVRPARLNPGSSTAVTLTSKPALVNEQSGLIWYAGDDDYIKLVKEMKEQPYIILGREEKGAAKTYGRIAMPADKVDLRLTLEKDKVVAHARSAADADWKLVGECALLSAPELKVGVFASVLPGETDRWAVFKDFHLVLDSL